MSGAINITPGKVFAPGERVTNAKLNQLGQPVAQIAAGQVGTSELNLTELLAASGLIGKNALLNANFDIWQLGDSYPLITVADGTIPWFVADHWTTYGAQNTTISRVPLPLGQVAVPDNPSNVLRWAQTVPLATAYPVALGQRIENVATFSGVPCTLSFYVLSDTSITIQALFRQYFGNGGAPSAPTLTTTQNFALTAGVWRKCVYTATPPSLTGKVKGTTPDSNGDCLMVKIIMPQGVVFSADFAHMQLEAGSYPTLFEPRTPASELIACQRYFEVIDASLFTSVANGYPATYWKVTKRANPANVYIRNMSGGVGAGVIPLGKVGARQNAANSVIATCEIFGGCDLTEV